MSFKISLKNTMAGRGDAVLHVLQHSLMIVGLVLIFGAGALFPRDTSAKVGEPSSKPLPEFMGASEGDALADELAANAIPGTLGLALSPRMQSAMASVARRYRVAPSALQPVFEVAQMIADERHLDPLLIVAIIGVESSFNPFAESAMGAQGLMQVIPRFHKDKLPLTHQDDLKAKTALLDPVINIRVGVRVLEEGIRRRGSLIGGLQYYGGANDAQGSYANKILAEKVRLEQAVRTASAATQVGA